ncbi:hypothetical protein LVJ84_10645 [Kingella potus]|nr:hypothetical protein [Kingella potus]UOP00344.1 hypothetical protein LVJ84_10645 [Kingella potus]
MIQIKAQLILHLRMGIMSGFSICRSLQTELLRASCCRQQYFADVLSIQLIYSYFVRCSKMKKSLLAATLMSLFLAACGGEKAATEAASAAVNAASEASAQAASAAEGAASAAVEAADAAASAAEGAAASATAAVEGAAASAASAMEAVASEAAASK